MLPVRPVTFPAMLQGVTNGRVPKGMLANIGPDGRLLLPAARAFQAFRFHLAGYGIPVTWTYGGTERNFDNQWNLWFQRYEEINAAQYALTSSKIRKRWKNAGQFGFGTYWRLKKQTNGRYAAHAACPGESNHGWAIAIDMARGNHPREAISIATYPVEWAHVLRDAESFGFSWESQDELWHVRYFMGDEIPQRVLDVEAFIAALGSAPLPPPVVPAPAPLPAPLPPPVPSPITFTEQIVQDLPVLNPGDSNFHVRVLTGLLVAHGHECPVTHTYGERVREFVVWFQVSKGLAGDGVVGPLTWRKLLEV